uniref:Uncharacterized protein n=1 Tax=Corvus moneduloides TaxID=1196302 RepID=A0A8C3EN59_CORMO
MCVCRRVCEVWCVCRAWSVCRGVFKSCSILVILLQWPARHVTTVELRDESAAAGRVTSVDAFMNVRLAEVTFTDRQGTVSHLDELFVTGRNIRYVHIPDEVDIQGRREFLDAKHK